MLPFHNAKHTIQVYENTIKISDYEKIDFEALEPILLAALFHDVGNAVTFKGHEGFSMDETIMFLLMQDYPEQKIQKVINYIEATRMPQKPTDIYENIICDADLYHLGTSEFLEMNKLLRKEWAEYLKIDYSDEAWNSLNIQFLQQHQFHTKYGKEILEPVKKQNIELLKQNQGSF
ncbi:HD domain-containing protein [Zobellia laminariae]|uniref:HD domain-containing protein n=1 Tax=Zobellia laminariae TaxID=248906 RepID=UPI0026F43A67|nr:HD domain-containing protein [Zobellia laminariae]WKX76918.1 HD domain-containing protein [Zobellia laminariae]